MTSQINNAPVNRIQSNRKYVDLNSIKLGPSSTC